MKEERHQKILSLLDQHRFITVRQVCQELRVSEMTIRRDLNLLADRGRLTRVSGGALAGEDAAAEPVFEQRARVKTVEKKAIATMAAGLIERGDVIGLGVGSSTGALARQIRMGQAITVVTNWVPNAVLLAGKKQIRVFLLGGMVRIGELSTFGDSVTRAISDFQLDKYFFSVSGVDPEKGLVDFDSGEVLAMQTFISHARESILLVDSSKLGRTAPAVVGPISMIGTVVTDPGISPEYIQILERHNVQVKIAR